MMHKNSTHSVEGSNPPAAQPVLVVGARGYSGVELIRILMKHPGAQLEGCFASSNTWKLSEFLPETYRNPLAAELVKPMSSLLELATERHTVFLATPAEVSLEWVPQLLRKGAKVIDLSGAYRLESESYPQWYGHPHTSPEILPQALYGLSPWAWKNAKKPPQLISNPGCYATSVLMALIPLLQARAIELDSIVIDSKSGTSGAGRKASENLLFTEVAQDFLPYRVGKHQHLPEIIRHTEQQTGATIDPHFTTHLLPVRRGISTAIYATLTHPQTDLDAIYTEAYSKDPLVHFGAFEEAPLASLKRVVGSARTQISYTKKGSRLYLFSVIDNLLKGAASQAIENFNQLHGLPSWTALDKMEGAL